MKDPQVTIGFNIFSIPLVVEWLGRFGGTPIASVPGMEFLRRSWEFIFCALKAVPTISVAFINTRLMQGFALTGLLGILAILTGE